MAFNSTLSFAGHIKPAPEVRPLLQIGCLLDIQTGDYYVGKHGESILNGGLAPMTGIGGRGNTFKSVLTHFFNLRVLDRYVQAAYNPYDTEMSLTPRRLSAISCRLENIAGRDLLEEGRLLLTDTTANTGNVWFDGIKLFARAKMKETDVSLGTTPFINRKGENIKAFYPSLASIDSFSRMQVDAVDKILDKNEVGESGNNMAAAKDAGSKHQMLIQMPALTAQAGLYITMTAHVDDELKLDPYAPNTKKLAYLKNNLKFKYVSNQFHFLTNNLWFCLEATPLKHRETKAAQYPRDSTDTDPDNNDLMSVTLINLRGKNGQSGTPFEILLSQTEGVLPSLTELHYLISNDYYGLGGSNQNYYVELCPDIALKRTTARKKIDESPALRRALEITSEICQLTRLKWTQYSEVLCTPKELYDDLKKMGYDWNVLLGKTRGYWVFEEDDNPLKFLSTLDLLRMRKNLYRPWWYDEVVNSAK